MVAQTKKKSPAAAGKKRINHIPLSDSNVNKKRKRQKKIIRFTLESDSSDDNQLSNSISYIKITCISYPKKTKYIKY